MIGLREAAAIVLAAAAFAAALRVVRAAGRQPMALALPVALALLVAWESLLLNLLSFGRLGAVLRPRGVMWALVPLVTLLALSAVLYPPTNWDSMTYHMARVAHWMQNRSIRYYPTFVQRQNEMAPGAEYLLLVLQLVARSDRWANVVQLFAYVVSVVGVGGLLRVAGLPRRLTVYAQLFVASLPMAILQAATTQNDLVAAAMSLAIASTSLPFLRRSPRRWTLPRVLLLAVSAAGGMLVKPTSVMSVLWVPLLAAISVAAGLRRRPRPDAVRLALAGGLAALLVALLLVPDYARRRAVTGSPFGRPHAIYPSDTPWRDRLANVFAAHCQSALFPSQTRPVLERITAVMTADHRPPPLHCLTVYKAQEDLAGYPFQAAVTLGLMPGLLLLARGRGLRRLMALTPVVGWCVVHFKLRNQIWLSRLQLPLFVLSPLVWVAWMTPLAGRIERVRAPIARFLRGALGAAALACLCYGYVVVANVRERPLLVPQLASVLRDRDVQYYVFRPDLAPGQDATLRALAQTGCRRLGLLIGEDTYDYPLTWRAMRTGVEVRHYVVPSDWPCAVYSDAGAPAGNGWGPAGPQTWVRAPPP